MNAIEEPGTTESPAGERPRDDRPVSEARPAESAEPGGLLGIAGALAAGRRRSRLARFLRWAAVVPLLVLWIVGWLTPVVPGFPFLLVALFLMAPDFPPAHRFAAWLQRKLPRLRRTIPRHWRRTKRERR